MLSSLKNMDERIKAWTKIYSSKNIKGTKEWAALSKIKKARNDFVHTKNVGFNYQLKDIIEIMNCSVDGIGGLLHLMHSYSQGKGYLGFIQQLMNQGKIEIKN